jgi:hypothetical protein
MKESKLIRVNMETYNLLKAHADSMGLKVATYITFLIKKQKKG